MPFTEIPVSERFWDKVTKSDSEHCWPWTSVKDSAGYGLVNVKKKRLSASRIAWKLANGPIPEGLFVLHRCDNPPCCNPAHLFLGTKSDNTQDCLRKGRHPRARITHCVRGHLLDGENVRTRSNGRRECVLCCRIRASKQ
jgi:hypothetical protein